MCQTRKHNAPPFILNGKWFVMLPQYTLRYTKKINRYTKNINND